MSLKTENEALREQVARLTERLANVRKEEELLRTITEMKRQATSQQEEMENLRKSLGRYEKDALDAYSRRHLHEVTLQGQVTALEKEKAKLERQIITLTKDNARLTDRLAEVSKVDL